MSEKSNKVEKIFRVGASVDRGDGSSDVVEETISATSKECAGEHLWQLLERLNVETWVIEEDGQ